MNSNWQEIVDKYYPAGSPLRDIYLKHCTAVARKALELARRRGSALSDSEIVGAAMTHDLGIVRTHAPGIECHGTLPYILHGPEGAAMLRLEGAPESWARVAERHTGSGITADEIRAQQLPLPPRDMLPETELERLICLADKFFSKGGAGNEKSLTEAREAVARHSAEAGRRFDLLAAEWLG